MNLFLAWFWLACGPTHLQDTTPIPASEVSRSDHLDGELQHLDPGLGGWDTEIFASRAAEHLDVLMRIALAGTAASGRSLPTWVSEEVECSLLRPPNLLIAEQPGLLQLRRGEIPAARETGRDALAQVLGDLCALFTEVAEPAIKIKVVRVAVDPPTTELLFRVWGEARGGSRIQSDLILACEWNLAGDALELLKLQASSYSESQAPASFYADCSVAVMGRTRAWREQLLFGTDAWCGRIEQAAGMDQYGHCGLVVLDVDRDGLEDLYVCQAGGLPNILLRQNSDGSATDVAAHYGLDWLDNTRAALWVDFDGDGAEELALATSAGLLITGRGASGRFEVQHVLKLGGGYSMAAADFDGDGWVDLYICKYATAETKSGLPAPYHDANNGPANVLYRNRAGKGFDDVTDAVGLGQHNSRFSFAAAWADYDEDGDPDLYVANDFGRNCLYRNDRGRFLDVAAEAGVEDISAGMGVSWGDYDGDGHLDLLVSNMFSSAGQRIAYQRRFRSSSSAATRASFQRHARGNSLFKNRGDGTFEDVSVASGTWMGRWAWGAGFVDFDNDGDRDILVPNGFITNEHKKDL